MDEAGDQTKPDDLVELHEFGRLEGVSCRWVHADRSFLAEVVLRFDSGLSLSVRAVPDDDTVTLHVLKDVEDDQLVVASTEEPWRACIGRRPAWAWDLTNNLAHTDAWQVHFGSEGPDDPGVLVQFLVIGSEIRVYALVEQERAAPARSVPTKRTPRADIPKVPIHVVVRVDPPIDNFDPDALGMRITPVAAVPTWEEADAEARRLNALNGHKGCVYFWAYTRFYPGGRQISDTPVNVGVALTRYIPAASTVAFIGALTCRFPMLLPVLQSHLDEQGGEVLPHIFMGAVERWARTEFMRDPAAFRPMVVSIMEYLHQADLKVGSTGDVHDLIYASFVEGLPWPGQPGYELRQMFEAIASADPAIGPPGEAASSPDARAWTDAEVTGLEIRYKMTTTNEGTSIRIRDSPAGAVLEADAVHSRETFCAFLEGLAGRVRAGSPVPNDTLDSFLGGVAGWAADMDGYFQNRGEEVPAEPSWQLLAHLLAAGLVYE